MEEEHANALAQALGGDVWQSGGDLWLVLLRRPDGRVIVFSDEAVCEYSSEEAIAESQPFDNITLC